MHGTRSTTRSTPARPHPARTARSVTGIRSSSASAGQSRTAPPENPPARTPGDHSERAPKGSEEPTTLAPTSPSARSSVTLIVAAAVLVYFDEHGRRSLSPPARRCAAGLRGGIIGVGLLTPLVVPAGFIGPPQRSVRSERGLSGGTLWQGERRSGLSSSGGRAPGFLCCC